MSIRPDNEPVCSEARSTPGIETVIDARPRNLGGVAIRRVLPSALRRMVGPFAFLDHMGPVVFAPGAGIDVPPHPHIGLATVTYLLEGEMVHRDSLGSEGSIRPGDINWMTAGRGIVHSERTSTELRREGSRLHGLQIWVALPLTHEEADPSFHHHPGSTLPEVDRGAVRLRVLAGTAYGGTSPVEVLSPLFYVDASMPAGSELPLPEAHEERAAYVVEGSLRCGAERVQHGRMLVFATDADLVLFAEVASRIVLIGGAPLEGARHIDWNFVSSSKARIEQAKRDWRTGRFPIVPGDETEAMPLPE